jgi:hypothetical protein
VTLVLRLFVLLDPADRLVRVRGIRNDPAILAVDQQIELFERSLSDDHFIAQYQSLIQRSSAIDLDLNRLGHANHVLPAVSVLSNLILYYCQTKRLNNVRWHN